MTKKILYIGWIGYQNLGDDLLWHVFRDTASKYLSADRVKITPSLPGVNMQQLEPYDIIVLGGGSLIAPSYIKHIYRALQMGKKVWIWGSGIDRIPETTLKTMKKKQAMPEIQRFQGEERKQLREVLMHADFTGVRGPYTKKVLETLTGMSDMSVIGDPGLLLRQNQQTDEKQKRIGINWGTTNNNLYGSKEKQVEKELAEAANHFIAKGYKIYIYAVWNADFPACQRLAHSINDPDNVFFEKKLYTEQELMKELSSCSLTINFKLHPNVLSMSAGVPAIALGYRFKVFDFYASLGLENLVLSTSNNRMEEKMLKLAAETMSGADTVIATYRQKQQDCQPLIERPFTMDML